MSSLSILYAEFDPYDRCSWDHGKISREEANKLLEDADDGSFLIRESTHYSGEYVLSVKESGRLSQGQQQPISHYRIVPFNSEDGVRKYRIGENPFPDLPSLLNFYKLHYLDKTTLKKPISRTTELYIARYDFTAQQIGDLPFRKGETLSVLSKGTPEGDEWWLARNKSGEQGNVPCNYIQKYDPSALTRIPTSPPVSATCPIRFSDSVTKRVPSQDLPAYAKVIKQRVPNAYDKSALRLRVGDVVKVTRIEACGTCHGELNGRIGHFPFTFVEFLNSSGDNGNSRAQSQPSSDSAHTSPLSSPGTNSNRSSTSHLRSSLNDDAQSLPSTNKPLYQRENNNSSANGLAPDL